MAGRLARMFIHSPLTPLLLVACLGLGILGLGIMGLILTPRQEDPQISVPMVDNRAQVPVLINVFQSLAPQKAATLRRLLTN